MYVFFGRLNEAYLSLIHLSSKIATSQKEGDEMGLSISKLAKAIFLSILFLMAFTCLAQSEGTRLNLDQIVNEALQNNPEILAAKSKWEAYKYKIPQASALEDPMFSRDPLRGWNRDTAGCSQGPR